MREFAPPQYSSDGRWWWNGRGWVPVTWPIQTRGVPWDLDEAGNGRGPRRRRAPGVLWIGILALALLLLLSYLAVYGRLGGHATGTGGSSAPAQTQATPGPVPTPLETPAISPVPSGSDAYRSQIDKIGRAH